MQKVSCKFLTLPRKNTYHQPSRIQSFDLVYPGDHPVVVELLFVFRQYFLIIEKIFVNRPIHIIAVLDPKVIVKIQIDIKDLGF
jgi:hypothetical protein